MVNTNTAARTITFAHSPDPDDAYMFYGFETGAVTIPGYTVQHHLEDIQTLNERALKKEFEITAVSAHAYAHLWKEYWVLSCGASVGRGYGPMLVVKQGHSLSSVKKIAIPGKWTTAALTLDLWLKETGLQADKIVIPFDKILDVVEQGQVDAGLIIHEGQLTYKRQGLEMIWNAGGWWKEKTGLPLPLGLDVVRKDLGEPLALDISRAFRASIEYANSHRQEAVKYAMQFGRGLDHALSDEFIGMYVNRDTLDQGPDVQAGLQALYDHAFASGLIPEKPELKFV